MNKSIAKPSQQISSEFRWKVALLVGLAIAATSIAFSVPRFTDPTWVYNLAGVLLITYVPALTTALPRWLGR